MSRRGHCPPTKTLTAVALIASTVLFFVVNLMHPKEYKRDHEAQQLKTIADHYTRWQLAHFLTLLAIFLFVIVVCGFAWLLYSRLDRMALTGGLLALWGLVCLG